MQMGEERLSMRIRSYLIVFFSLRAVQWESASIKESEKPDLRSARVVVSGGRGLKSGDNFKLLDALAVCWPSLRVTLEEHRAISNTSLPETPYTSQISKTGVLFFPF